MKVLPANLENPAVATGLENSVFIPIPKKGNAKEHSNYHTIALISHASKVILKIIQARFQQYMSHELPDVQVGFTPPRHTHGDLTNLALHERLHEFLIVPREETHTGAAARGNT